MSDPSASSGQAERERVWEAYVEWCARNDPERTGDYGVFVGGWDARAAEVGRLRDAVQAQRRRIDWGDGESRRKVVYADAERDALRVEVGELRKISEMKDDLESENIDLRARLAAAEARAGELEAALKAQIAWHLDDGPCFCDTNYRPEADWLHMEYCRIGRRALGAGEGD